MVKQCIHIEYKSKYSWYNSEFTLNTKEKLMCIHIEYKSKNSWYNSVFTLNTRKYKLMKLKLMALQCIHIEYSVFTLNTRKLKLMASQCIHIEYRSKNSWFNSVFTLNTTNCSMSLTSDRRAIVIADQVARPGSI
ncbi:hypothetical protein OUZ56_033320 [Daphnia magna]|uniref:Uncharacterized protein n=1 Tax=Daphnia magna TaxID=35525 RepID=A0ABQ9ZXL3_9CRUS|nr:hypothetical protein OUZ56_033320 [Daphnia magna]